MTDATQPNVNNRIDAALARIDAAIARRRDAAGGLARRHAMLRKRVEQTITALDELIDAGARG